MQRGLDHLDRRTLPKVQAVKNSTSTVETATPHFEDCVSTDDRSYVGYQFAPFDGLVSFEEQAVSTRETRYAWRFTNKCWACGQDFASARSTSRTCSPRCRDRLKYARKQAEKAMNEALLQIDILSSMAQSPDPVMKERAREALRVVTRKAAETCLHNGINPNKR